MAFQLQPNALKGWRVVVIDDEPDSLEVVKFLLQRYGAEVHTATDGQSGLALINDVRPMFVVSDLAMPKITGEELVRRVKDDRVLSHIPMIALSAHAKKEDYARAISAGFHAYMVKPLRPETFVKDLIRLMLDIPHIASALEKE
ncbi:MAG: response regulator [Phototrophicales bacterium]|nr:MAG: response regulator [Phototrophicales bacterium]RMG74304.1 MAG: response regulator [Chloroflexota bacterium]